MTRRASTVHATAGEFTSAEGKAANASPYITRRASSVLVESNEQRPSHEPIRHSTNQKVIHELKKYSTNQKSIPRTKKIFHELKIYSQCIYIDVLNK